MKKFLVFLISIIVVLCLGLTTYYFLRNDEVIALNVREIFVNTTDTFSVEELGLVITKPYKLNATTIDYSVKGEASEYLSFDEEGNCYVVASLGGDVDLVISTSNKNFKTLNVKLHIGDGSIEHPYIIKNERQLKKVANGYKADGYYNLLSDIVLTSDFGVLSSFSGNFNGNGHTISNLNGNLVQTNLGLFSTITSGGNVHDLILDNFVLSGNSDYVGALAGKIDGTIKNIKVSNLTITNQKAGATIGGVSGLINGNASNVYVTDSKISVNRDMSETIGGLFGHVNKALVETSSVENTEIVFLNESDISNNTIGGFAGLFSISQENGSIRESLANTTCDDNKFGAFIGEIREDSEFDRINANNKRYLIGNLVISSDLTDESIVKTFDGELFRGSDDNTIPAFFDENLFMIQAFASIEDAIDYANSNLNNFVYYSLKNGTKTYWDMTNIWEFSDTELPKLKMLNYNLNNPTDYLLENNSEFIKIYDFNTFDYLAGTQENKNFEIIADINIEAKDWIPSVLKGCTLEGNNHTITINLKNANGDYVGLFKTIDNCFIQNMNIVITGISANAKYIGGFAGSTNSTDQQIGCQINNINISFDCDINLTSDYFGGLVAIAENTTINNCSVSSLNCTSENNIGYIGGLVGLLNESSVLANSSVSGTIYGSYFVAGVVAENAGTITNIQAEVNVNYNKNIPYSKVAGLVALNNGTINNVNATVNVEAKKLNGSISIAGVTAQNNGLIKNVTITGDKIVAQDGDNALSGMVYIGGICVVNNGNGTEKSATDDKDIQNVYVYITNIGYLGDDNSKLIDKNYKVAGVAVVNSATVDKVVISSNLKGNIVAGLAVEMNSSLASINEVLIGKINGASIEKVTISGRNYVAGFVVDFRLGSIENIEAVSNIVGLDNSTRSSLIVLVFPNGAVLRNSTIDSTIAGLGTKYREAWTDFYDSKDKSNFDLTYDASSVDSDLDRGFNLYIPNAFHGKMQSVVVNSKDLPSDIKYSFGIGNWFFWTDVSYTYDDNADSSFVKTTTEFNSSSTFTGSFELYWGQSQLLKSDNTSTKTLTFSVNGEDGIWYSNNGIRLSFLQSL